MATITALGIGSGLDLSGLLEQLEEAERHKLSPITQQKKGYEAKVSAYGNLQGALSQFQAAVNKLGDAKLFSSVKSSISGTALTAAAGNGAAASTYQIDVHELARHSSAATGGVADRTKNLGDGTVTVALNNGESFTVDIQKGNSSLESIRDAVNAADGGVTASLVNDGKENPWRLVLTSTDTGTQAGIHSIDFGQLSDRLAIDTQIAGVDARLTVNGIEITSPTNQVEQAIEGVTLALAETGEATLRIEQDSASVTSAIKGFVSAYNSLRGTISGLTSFDAESGAAGQLLGDGTLRNVQSKLRLEMQSVLQDGEFRRLGDLGITLQLDGTLNVDEERLESLVATQSGSLANFFAGAAAGKGFSGQLGGALETMIKSGGIIDNAMSGLRSSIKSLDTRYARMEQSIDATIARYRAQFSELDSMIATMNSTSSYLTQQFDILNAQLGQGRR